jgi:DNA-binding MarR family transcriptional regulator
LPNLEADGLISRRANKQDQRRVGVSLTAKGRRLFETVAPQSEAIYARLAQEIGPQRLEQVYGLLDEVIGILETPRPAVKSVAARSRVAVRRGKAG